MLPVCPIYSTLDILASLPSMMISQDKQVLTSGKNSIKVLPEHFSLDDLPPIPVPTLIPEFQSLQD
jgi:hypothetical protein